MKKFNFFVVLAMLVAIQILMGCGRNGSTDNNGGLKIVSDSIRIDASSIEGSLPSYIFVNVDGDIVSGYNYRTNSIDRYDLESGKPIGSIVLNREGADAIPGRISLIEQWTDSTFAIFDGIKLYEVSLVGNIKNSYELPSAEYALLDRNARSSASNILIKPDKGTVSYAVAENGAVSVVTYNFAGDSIENRMPLIELGAPKEYGFMRYPNVTVTDSLVIASFPYESRFTVKDRSTGDVQIIEDYSKYAADHAEKCVDEDPDGISRHGVVNPHYFPVEYMKDMGVYVQFYLTPSLEEYSNDIEKGMYSRRLCLKVFDDNFNKVGEWQLEENKFDPYMGWKVADNAIILFEDNILNDSDDSEDLLKITRLRLE